MRKTLYCFAAFIVFLMLQSLLGCSKKDTPITPPPCTTCPCTTCPAVPTITASISTQTPGWYNDSAVITYSTTNGDSVTINQQRLVNLSGTLTFKNLKRDSVIVFTVKGLGGTAIETLTLTVYSERRTLMCNYGPVHMISDKRCNVDSVNTPSAWHDGPDDCNTYQFFANDSAQMINGPCYPNPGSIFKSFWSFQTNESEILLSGFDLWHIDSLDIHGFQRSQIKAELFNPAVFFIAVQKFSH